MTVLRTLLLVLYIVFLIPIVQAIDSCITDSSLCVKSVSTTQGSDLSLTCMPNGQRKGGQWMYCGPKGGGIHFSVKWSKNGHPIETQSVRYILENDNQTLTLLNTSLQDTGSYHCQLRVFDLKNRFKAKWCSHSSYKNYYIERPFIFTEFPNITVSSDLYNGWIDQLNATFVVNVTGEGSESPVWDMASIYFSNVQVPPWVNFRVRSNQGFLSYEVMDLTRLHAWENPMDMGKKDPPEVSLNSYQEVVVVANIMDSVSFDCPVRTSVPLTEEVSWVFEYLPYTWKERTQTDGLYRASNSTTEVYNLTDTESLESCLFCNVTQRRWTLYVHNLTEEWDHCNLTCFIQNANGTAQVVYKVELLGVIPFEQELAPVFQYPYWCEVDGFSVQNECDYEAINKFISIKNGSSPIIELVIDVYIGDYDRAKVTVNIVPPECRSMNRSNPTHNCSVVLRWTEVEGFGYQQKIFSWDVYLGAPISRDLMSPQQEGYLWFWDTYNYALGETKKPDPVYYWVKAIMPPTTKGKKQKGRKGKKGQKKKERGPLLSTDAEEEEDIEVIDLSPENTEKVKDLKDQQSENHLVWISLSGVGVLVFFVIASVIIILLVRKKWLKSKSKRCVRMRKIVRIPGMQLNMLYLSRSSENSETPEASPLPEITIESLSGKDSTTNLVSLCDYEIPQDPKWEFPRSKLTFGSVLGEGAFGLVKKATAKDILVEGCDIPVAVKMLKDSSTDIDLKALLTELLVMKRIGECGHVNVIQLLGCCTNYGPVYVILEYAAHGNLKDYLRDSVSNLRKTKMLLSLGHLYPEDTVTVKTLLDFAVQVASGMEYLASLRIVHRDLAARNVLVADKHVLKITDFGFTRLLQDTEYYRTQNKGRFPVKWMAPEAISDNRCTSKSDVWSFGVLLWELFSLGSNPYPYIPFEVMIEHLQKGLRMCRPINSPELMYRLMLTCWAHSSKKRPSFSQLFTFLGQIHSNQIEDGLPVMPESDHEEMTWYYPGSFARASGSSSLAYLGSSVDRDHSSLMSRDELHPQIPRTKYGSSELGSPLLGGSTSQPCSSNEDTSITLTPPHGQVFCVLESGEAVCDHKLAPYPICNMMTLSESVENLENSVFQEMAESPVCSLERRVGRGDKRGDMYGEEGGSEESLEQLSSPVDVMRDNSSQSDKSSVYSVNTSQHKVRFQSGSSFSPNREEPHSLKGCGSPKKGIILKSSLSPKSKNTMSSIKDSKSYYKPIEDKKFSPSYFPSREMNVSPTLKTLAPATSSTDSLARVGKFSPKEVDTKIVAALRPHSLENWHSISSPSIATLRETWSAEEDMTAFHSVETVSHSLITRGTRKKRRSTDSCAPLLSDVTDSDKSLN